MITRAKRGDAVDCECVPGHRCDCDYLRGMLYAILTSAEYDHMEAEGAAADALNLRWSERYGCYERQDAALSRAATRPAEEPGT